MDRAQTAQVGLGNTHVFRLLLRRKHGKDFEKYPAQLEERHLYSIETCKYERA